MHFFQLIQQIIREMRARTLRSILALSGIVWGTLAVTLLLALGTGFYHASKNTMRGFVDGTLLFNPGITSRSFDGFPRGRRLIIKASDAVALKNAVPGIAALSPIFYGSTTISRGQHYVTATVQGTSASYARISQKQPAPGGRFFDKLDIASHRAVVFIGPEIKNSLFNKRSSRGHTVFVNHIPFTVIGVLPKQSNRGRWYNNMAIIPYTTFIALWGNKNVDQILILPKNIARSTPLKIRIMHYLSEKFYFSPQDKSAMYVFDTSQTYAFFTWFFGGILVFLGFCGAMTLGVGGVGVANVMFLIVTERTHEIGLRMALGARTSHIMGQIMLEALLIVLLGGFTGFTLSALSVFALQRMSLPHWLGSPQLSFTVFAVTLIILAITALLAGYFPARRAAKMTPVTALAF